MIRQISFVCVLAALTLGQTCTPTPPQPESTPLPRVKMVTSSGTLIIELFTDHTPPAVKFKELVEAGYYKNTVFHEVRQNKWIVGGQYNESLERSASQTLVSDSANGLVNLRGRVSLYGPATMTTGVPQFLINLADNTELDYTPSTGQAMDYTVIGRVVNTDGMTTADAIGNATTTTRETADGTSLSHIPAENIVITDAYVGQGVEADAGGNLVALLNRDVTLDASKSLSVYGENLTYAWTQTGGTTVTLKNPDTATASFRTKGIETYTFKLTVRDEKNNTDTDDANVTVLDKPNVRLSTTMGDIEIEMYEQGAPITVTNFLQYVHDGFYNGTIFHRVMPDFVIQGGGFLPDLVAQKVVRDPITNEFSSTRSNVRGSLAMAKRGSDPNSATSQFFFNLVDNNDPANPNNLDSQNGGFTVFAHVVKGMNIVTDIARVDTETKTDPNGDSFDNVPVQDVIITSATIIPRPATPQFVTTASGLQYKDTVIGTGSPITLADTISIYYVGRLNDQNGDIFDSSGDRKTTPVQFALSGLIEGWKEGLTNYDMRAGGTRILIVPPELGYGAAGSPPAIPPNATLYFEIEVVEVVQVLQ
jgi:cyclophilin family peptidyl-prolyl cis-trans isomerase